MVRLLRVGYIGLTVFSILVLVFAFRRLMKGESIMPRMVFTDTYKSCRPKNTIAFLKIHKCASSSVQNILLRYTLNNQLNMILPSRGHYLGAKIPFQRAMIADTPWERANLTYNMYALHGRWNQGEVSRMLGPSTTFITMLRDPVSQFESSWGYANLGKFYNTDLETFALSEKTGKFAKRHILGRNQMLWDMGLPENLMDNPAAVKLKIEEAEQNFDLILISERFQESVILLKEQLCWDYRDVVNLKLNARQNKTKSSISPEARAALEEYLAADYQLYNYFKQIFEAKIEAFGKTKMSNQLEILRHANSNIKRLCDLEETNNGQLKGERRIAGHRMVGYKGNNSDIPQCRFMAIAERSFVEHLRQEQGNRAQKVLDAREEEGISNGIHDK